MQVTRVLVIALLIIAMVSIASPAFGYASEVTSETIARLPLLRAFLVDPDDPGSGLTLDPDADCFICHGTQAADEASGPHGGYLSTTNKCAVCHSVHTAAAGGSLMLPAATIKDTCETCHDGTAGTSVYGAIEAQNLTVASDHEIVDTTSPTTNNIPGGDPAGGSLETTFAGPGGNLTCTDCHSPHGNDLVDAFTGDRARASLDTTVTSARLLRQRPTSATGDVTTYGSDWCGACHKGRLSGSGATGNHPVDSSITQTQTAPFHYDNVARVTGVLTTSTEMGTLGRNNFGYVMPEEPRSAQQQGHYPICQQCHEDVRTVGNEEPQQIDTAEVYSVTATDGAVASDNPRFQVFPHESTNAGLLLEADDDVCLNCHVQP